VERCWRGGSWRSRLLRGRTGRRRSERGLNTGEEFGEEGFGFGDLGGEFADGGAVFGVAFAFELAELGAEVFEGGLEEGVGVGKGLGIAECGLRIAEWSLGGGRGSRTVMLARHSRPTGAGAFVLGPRVARRRLATLGWRAQRRWRWEGPGWSLGNARRAGWSRGGG
jgi:hypothetical protein